MESSLVIKVKYGDTLRRFNARVDDNNKLDLDMGRLRFKICSLFNFPVETNFMLKYVDEDGDLVTLVDNDDLLDVMRQNLKFLKIELHMENDNTSKPNSVASGSSTPLRSPSIPNPLMRNGNIALFDDLKSVPEPVLEFFSNLSLDMASKAASSSPVVASLIDSIAKLGQSMRTSNSQPVTAAGVQSKSDASKEAFPHVPSCPEIPSADLPSEANQQLNDNVTRGVAAPVAPVDLNVVLSDSNPSQSTYADAVRVSSTSLVGEGDKGKKVANDKMKCKPGSPGASTSQAAPGNTSTQSTPTGFSTVINRPSVWFNAADAAAPTSGNHRDHPFIKRSHRHTEAMCGVFHKGVRCDGCGVSPITGPRYKSIVKVNYDLCSNCFSVIGNGVDYFKIDRPVRCHRIKILPEHRRPMPHLYRMKKDRDLVDHWMAKTRVDSKFILDVTVEDHTLMAPSTAFTKIWRMRNNGNVPWPKGCQLVCTGGDKFSDFERVDLEIPEEGILEGQDLDIAVDFRAPETRGRYISYWRMALPGGYKFGQCVWVLIVVDDNTKGSFFGNFQGINLNIPAPEESDSEKPKNISEELKNISLWSPSEYQVDKKPGHELGENLCTHETTPVGLNGLPPTTSGENAPISYPIIDIDYSYETPVATKIPDVGAAAFSTPKTPDVSAAASSTPKIPDVLAAASSSRIHGDNTLTLEETLLKELEEMGFKQIGLNKEILRKNEYDLEQSVDDLCGIPEWDPLLEELSEMGFRDNEVNKRLLKKNNGSIKRVVMDLVNGEDV